MGLPSGWESRKLKTLVVINYGKGLPERERRNGIYYVYGANGPVGNHNEAFTNGQTIIIGRKGSVGAVNWSDQPCWPIDTTYYIDEYPAILDRQYLYYFLKSQPLSSMGRSAAIPGLNRNDLYKVEIPIPFPSNIDQSKSIQRQIVARIEALLSEVREMRKIHQNIISDLNILFDSVLAQTFKEINKKAKNTSSLEQITTVTSGGTPSRTNLAYYTGDIPWVKTGELIDGDIDDTEEHISEKAVQESNAKIYPKDTLLIAMYGQGQTRGRTGILRKAAASNQACCAIYPNPNEFDTRYLQYWFQFMYKELRKQSESRGGSQPNLNQTIIKRLVPPLIDVVIQKGYIIFLDQVKTQVAEMKAEETSKEKLFNQLERSILEKAFEGNF